MPWALFGLTLGAAIVIYLWARQHLSAFAEDHEALQRELAAERTARAVEVDRLTADRDAVAAEAAEHRHRMREAQDICDRLNAVLEALPLPVWCRGPDLQIVDCNRAYVVAVEAEREVVLRERRELGGRSGAPEARELAEAARTSGTERTRRCHAVIAGSRRLMQLSETPLANGTTVGVAIDVTAQEEAERDFARHAAAHAEVLENLATAIAIYGADTRLKFFNTAFARLWRLEPAWLSAGPGHGEVLEAMRERRRLPEVPDFPSYKRQRLRLFTSLIEPLEELTYIPDGTTLRARIVPHPMGGLLHTFEDVTDKLVLERSYNTLIAVQRETLDNLHEGIMVIGSDGRLKLYNPAFRQIWKLSQDTLALEPHITTIVDLTREFFADAADAERFRERNVAILTDRRARTKRQVRRDGSVLDYAQVPLPDGNTLISYLDVTDSARVERALRERAEALETADRLKSEFIANVSYELRTPLNTIIGFAEILDHCYFGPLNDRQREYTSGIIESSERLSTIIGDILDLALIEAGGLSLEVAAVDLGEVIEEVGAITTDWARQQGLQLVLNRPDEPVCIEGDGRRLKQALYNLISNAIKFTPSGGRIEVSAGLGDGEAVITVADTGVGIAEDEQARVFEKFERSRDSAGRQTGAGLGLSLVKSLIELHGGRLRLDSAPQHGTTVTCRLPIRQPSAA